MGRASVESGAFGCSRAPGALWGHVVQSLSATALDANVNVNRRGLFVILDQNLTVQRTTVHFPGRIVRRHSPSSATYTITDLAREFDVTPRAIRFYEDQACSRPTARAPAAASASITAASAPASKPALRGKG